MALTGTARGTGTHNTGATSFTVVPTSNFNNSPGTWAVLFVAADNSSSGGATNDFTTITDTNNNPWHKLQSPIFDNGAASAGVQGVIAATSRGGNITTGTTITVNFGSSPVAKTWWLMEIVPGTGKIVTFVQGGNGTGATSSTPTVTSGTITNGNLVACSFFKEAGTGDSITTDDTDSTNGSWANSNVSQYAEVGTTTTGSVIAGNWKIVTGTATQTYNLSMTSSGDYIASWAEFMETAKHLLITGVGR